MPDPVTNLLGQLIVYILIKHELQNHEIYIFQNHCIAVPKSLSQTKVLKYGMKSHVRFAIYEQPIASKKN